MHTLGRQLEPMKSLRNCSTKKKKKKKLLHCPAPLPELPASPSAWPPLPCRTGPWGPVLKVGFWNSLWLPFRYPNAYFVLRLCPLPLGLDLNSLGAVQAPPTCSWDCWGPLLPPPATCDRNNSWSRQSFAFPEVKQPNAWRAFQ